ncbi:MAG: peptide ABC transporter substrate-binding protein [Chloroflexota bacterium]|nr:peptide ABC transporter substrate-binding protein [Chloroflexota bacterium]
MLYFTRVSTALLAFCLLLILAACESGSVPATSGGALPLAPRQVLTFPNVGTQEIGYLDPAQQPDPNDPTQGPDPNSALGVGMLYSGLVRFDKDLNVVSDQATWSISQDNRVYTFYLKPGITFSDGTPVTAQSYVYTLTRALLPEVKSPVASTLEGSIVGAKEVSSGKTKTLPGVKAPNAQTVKITLVQPSPFFLKLLANPLYFPLNKRLIDQYGQTDWINHAPGSGAGTGPFMLKEWDHNVKMMLVPNPHYYGAKTRLTEVDMVFVNEPGTAFASYRAGQYDFMWNIQQNDLAAAKGMAGFISTPLLQTDLLFFNTTMPPFDKAEVRQAFAYAIDKVMLAHNLFKDSVVPAQTIIPPGMPGYQPNYPGLAYDATKAKSLLQSVYPNVNAVPTITFSYPTSELSLAEAGTLRRMWLVALGGIQLKLFPTELNAYLDEKANHQIQLGFTEWNADYPDPYDWLARNLLSTAPNNSGQWANAGFDQAITQAEQASADARIALYNQAEQIAINDVAWLPLDHQSLAAVIPSWVHGITLNGMGLYFGDWSTVYLSPH